MSRKTYDVIFDYDDIVYPWSRRAHELCEAAGITNGKQVTQWEMWRDYGCEEQVLWDVLGEATVSGALYDAPLIPGVTAQMRRLRGYGHRVHIVTARGFGPHGDLIESITREQIRHHHIPMDSLTFSKDKTVVEADFALDDGYHNYTALNDAGVLVFLMDMPHNQAFEARRVHSAQEFADIVLGADWC